MSDSHQQAAPPGLEMIGLALRYEGQTLFEGLNLTAEAGRCTALLGASGVGKTTLLRIAAGLAVPETGHVRASDGLPLTGRVTWMGQQDLLYPWARVLENVTIGSRLRGQRADKPRALKLLDAVGLHGREGALPKELSGGMRQRVALARTLYEDRPVVLMDEPFSALDAITRAAMQELAARLLAGRTMLLITHDPLEACRLGHSLYVLAGKPARLGPALIVPGTPPRAPDDDALLHTQGELLRALLDGQTA
ncbi:ABC transporter ATP-binding protein [Acidocella aminolytica]|jgi:putative hydroxymethylpyrimidine transport system ATP-binding protein|uniref:ABC transporter n=1 Tax=Acidocella aminolytica 101 = DSM 11237 TaxID=1120923 RepID=A0A0D6PFH2_9PROT|nr:ABC transporter ATP-binding protein [Acidocella aminolytica]GAN79958.1 ABC transporter [Acidocella aminolytica 101 = DSM 11237]GBQ38245.1 ABC transporter aliphatic sulfonates transporter ATP-binding protein [Acidocella aminolytica 101 = DSM 11237]SHE58350.1 putative hydroxymethylpyrimidine transport system ATP-binding protein [Acidocella aminolytica 101 = DSM 11237]